MRCRAVAPVLLPLFAFVACRSAPKRREQIARDENASTASTSSVVTASNPVWTTLPVSAKPWPKSTPPDHGSGFLRAEVTPDGALLLLALHGSPVGLPFFDAASIERLDPTSQTWTHLDVPTKPLITGIDLHALPGGRLLAVNLTSWGGPFGTTVRVYDPATKAWADKALTPIDTATFVGILPDGRAVLFGGPGGPPAPSMDGSVYLLDTDTLAVTRVAPLLVKQHYEQVAGVISKDGRVVVVSGDPATARTSIYDPIADAWTALPTPPSLTCAATSWSLSSGRIAAACPEMGGERVDVLDLVTSTWTTHRPSPSPESPLAWLADDRAVFVAPNGYGASHAFIFDPANDTTVDVGPLDATAVPFALGDGNVVFVPTTAEPDVLDLKTFRVLTPPRKS